MRLQKVLLYAVGALVAWKAGLPLIRLVLGVLASGLGAVFGTSGSLNADPSSLKAAIRNVTTDYDQLAVLLQEFFRQTSLLQQDNSTEVAFRDFLGERASKSRPTLEQGLDWILAIYKVIWPVLVVFLISKLNSGKSRPPEEEELSSEDAATASHRWSNGSSRLPNGEFSPSARDASHAPFRKQRSYPHRTSSGGRTAPLASTKSGVT